MITGRTLVFVAGLMFPLPAISQNPGCPNFTPPPNLEIRTSFCTDPAHSWVALYYAVEDRSSVAATMDGGKHWAIHEVGVAGYGPSSIFFLDQRNGWLMLFFTASMHDLSCKMLVTKNGGATWTDLHSPKNFPPCGEMRFNSLLTGWVLGSYGSDPISDDPIRLWKTRDGGNTWNPQPLPRPKECGRCEIAWHEPPEFRDSNHGEFEVEFIRSGIETFDVKYITANGGRSWKIGKLAKEVPTY